MFYLLPPLNLFCQPWLPASNLLHPVGFVAAERTLYCPSLGWSVLLAAGWARLQARLGRLGPGRASLARAGLAWLTSLALLAAGARLVCRNTVWRDRAALFTSGLQSAPTNAKVFSEPDCSESTVASCPGVVQLRQPGAGPGEAAPGKAGLPGGAAALAGLRDRPQQPRHRHLQPDRHRAAPPHCTQVPPDY